MSKIDDMGVFAGITLGCMLIGALVIMFVVLIYTLIAIELPQARARRDYLIANPHALVVNEWQRGGELPEVNVNLRGVEELRNNHGR